MDKVELIFFKVILNKNKTNIFCNEGYCFYKIVKGNFEYITYQYRNNITLEAITKDQYNNWKNQKIIAIKSKIENI